MSSSWGSASLGPPPLPEGYQWDRGVARPIRRRERWWLHALLLLLTFGTTTWVGAGFVDNFVRSGTSAPPLRLQDLLVEGAIQYALPLLAILLSHEMGHYYFCRKYGIDASPPYFMPMPPILFFTPGTFGAFIRVREQIRKKDHLFDMGVAGPIAGFLVALPILAFGILHTRINPQSTSQPGTLVFGYPLLVTLFQKALLGRSMTSLDVIEHPTFMAAWFGLLVTALNLLPLGQLDGGHAFYALVGRHQKKLAIPLLFALAIFALEFPGWWLWVVLILVLGTRHPPVDDEHAPLGARRTAVAALVLAMLILCFSSKPIWFEEDGATPSSPRPPKERRGTVVHELHLHGGAEDAGRHVHPVRS